MILPFRIFFLLTLFLAAWNAHAINGYPDGPRPACWSSAQPNTIFYYWPPGSALLAIAAFTDGAPRPTPPNWSGPIDCGGTPRTTHFYGSNAIGCVSPAVPDASGKCVTPPPPSICETTSGQVVSSGLYDLGILDTAKPPNTTCDGACELSYTGSGIVARQTVGGAYHYFSQGSYTRTKTACSTSTALAGVPTIPSPSCNPLTQDQGTVNGKFVCLNRTNQATTTTAKPVTNADGSTSQTTTTVDTTTGNTTTTTNNTAVDGSKTSTTETKPTPGTPGDSTEFCKNNPSDPSCTKDDIPWGTIPEAGIIPTHNVPVTTAYTVVGGEGQCPAPSSIDVFGQLIEWTYQPVCTFAQMIRPLLIGLSWLSFAFIVVGGIKGK